MDVAALSVGMSQLKVQQQAGLSVMKMAMNVGKAQMDGLLQMTEQSARAMERSVQPNLGGNIDVRIK
jgi:hypothetical protein